PGQSTKCIRPLDDQADSRGSDLASPVEHPADCSCPRPPHPWHPLQSRTAANQLHSSSRFMEKDRGLECTLAAPNNDDVLVAELFKIALLGCVGHEFRRKFLKQTWPM